MKNPALAAAIFISLSAPLFAQSAGVTVTQVKASGSVETVTIDPRLGELGKTLAKTFRYSQYAFLSSNKSAIAAGGTATWKLADGNFLDVTFSGIEGEGSKAKLTLALAVYSKTDGKRKNLETTTVRGPRGKSFILGRPESKAFGGRLILVIKAG